MNTILKVAIGVVLGFFLLVAGCFVCFSYGAYELTNEMEAQKERIKVSDLGFSSGEYGNRLVAGTAKNTSEKTLSYAQIEISLFDDAGNVVGSTIANINNLAPGQAWQFEALVVEDRATRAQVTGTSGF